MRFDFGCVVLVPFPFTSLTASKRRAAIVISNGNYSAIRPDVVVMAITSQLRPNVTFGDISINDWKAAGLLKPSVIKPVFATLEQTLIIRQLGVLHVQDQQVLRQAITEIIG